MNRDGKVAVKLMIVVIVVVLMGYFLPVTSGMKRSMAKGLLSCPSQAYSMAEMMGDQEITYFEYIQFRINCTVKKME